MLWVPAGGRAPEQASPASQALVLVEKSRGIASVTPNRPEQRNVISQGFSQAVTETFRHLQAGLGVEHAGVVPGREAEQVSLSFPRRGAIDSETGYRVSDAVEKRSSPSVEVFFRGSPIPSGRPGLSS